MSDTVMPDGAPIPARFRDCFEVLQRAAESARSIVYTFVLIHGALLLWALNSIVYPGGQNRLGQIATEGYTVVQCLHDRQTTGIANEKCHALLTNYGLQTAGSVAPQPTSADTGFAADEHVAGIVERYMSHRIDRQYDETLNAGTFNIPFVGVSSDRNWVWLVSVAMGLFFYYLIRDAFRNVLRMLSYLFESNRSAPDHLMLLSTTQIVSASSAFEGVSRNDQASARGAAKSSIDWKTSFVLAIMAAPLLISALMLYDWGYYTGLSVDTFKAFIGGKGPSALLPGFFDQFKYEPERWSFLLIIPTSIWEIRVFVSIVSLFQRLNRQHHDILDALSSGRDRSRQPTSDRPAAGGSFGSGLVPAE